MDTDSEGRDGLSRTTDTEESMSDFDDVLVPTKEDEIERPPFADERGDARPRLRDDRKRQEGPTSLVELLTGSDDASLIATKLNLDPDLSERLVIPLINLLDKYGLGESIAESPSARTATGLMEFVQDIAPVVRGAADYVNGKRKELSDEDRMFLDRIRDTQEVGDMSLFLGESEGDEEDEWGEAEEIEVVTSQEPVTDEELLSGRIQGNPFHEGIDWAQVMNPLSVRTKSRGISTFADALPDPNLLISGLEDLAREAGLDPKVVKSADTQAKINQGGDIFSSSVDYTEGDVEFDLGLNEINQAMDQEKKRHEAQSQVQYPDGMPIPESLSEHDPITGPSPTPTTSFNLPSVDELMSSAGVETFSDSRNPEEASMVGMPETLEDYELEEVNIPPSAFRVEEDWEDFRDRPVTSLAPPTLEEEVLVEKVESPIVSRLDPGRLRGHQRAIYEILYDAGVDGLSDEEGQNLILVDGSSYRPARKRLVEAGYVSDAGFKRKNANNRSVKIWVTAGPGLDQKREVESDGSSTRG